MKDSDIKIWEPREGKEVATLEGGHMGAVYSLAVLKHKDVEMLASGSDRDIILWAAKGWKKLKTLQGLIILAPPAVFLFMCLYRRQFDNLRERMLWWGAPSPTRSSSWLRSSGIYAHMLMLNNAQHVLMTSHFFKSFFPRPFCVRVVVTCCRASRPR